MELEDELSRAEQENAALLNEIEELKAEVERLHEQVRGAAEERHADTARLSWLDSELAKHGQVELRSDRWSGTLQRYVGRCRMFTITTQRIEANDVRAVIDVAIALKAARAK